MAPRFSRPRLIDENDKQYRAFVAQIMMTKDNHRPTRPPLARELFGGEAEAALRGWLSERFTLSDRRLVEYLEHRGRSATKKYRELDAVVIDGKTIQVFEMKASQKATSLRRASQQLRDTRTIVQMLYPRVLTTILLVDTGIPKTAADVAALMAEEDAPFEPPPTLDEVLAILPHVKQVASLDERDPSGEIVNMLRFSVEDIIAMVGAENLHLNWDEEEMDVDGEDVDAQQDEPRYVYTSSAEQTEDENDNPLAAALRKAIQGQQ